MGHFHRAAFLTPFSYERGYAPDPMDEMLQLAANAHVMDQLTADGVNVALPVSACDIDLVAFVESRTAPGGIVFVPIQVAVLHGNELSRNIAAARASDLLIALIWNVDKPGPIRSFAFTSSELKLVKTIHLMDLRSSVGMHSLGPKQSTLQSAIEPFAMSSGKWVKKLLAIIAGNAQSKPSESFG